MKVIWSKTAELSFAEELDYIFIKWGIKEVEKFINLSDEFLKILQSGLVEGKPSKKRDIRLFVISKQTTLVYKIDTIKKQIVLILFWNNLKNPKGFEKLIRPN